MFGTSPHSTPFIPMTLSKKDTAFLKGIAILMIMLHNFCHHLPMSVTENEYTFAIERFEKLCSCFSNGGPHIVLNTISHFGHYGVPLFLFLSGYGLVCKYELSGHRRHHRDFGHRTLRDLKFVWGHMVKMWKLMLPAIAIYWSYCMFSGETWRVQWGDLAAMLTFTSNLFIERELILGPWWFFSLIIQLYIVYRLVLYHHRDGFTLVAITAVCFMLQAYLYIADVRLTPEGAIQLFDKNPCHHSLFKYCRYNFVSWLLPFAAGILTARSRMFQDLRPGALPLLLCSIAGVGLTVWAATDAMQWLLSPLYALMALLPMVFLIKRGVVRPPLEWIGGISATLFALHPIARAMTITAAKNAEMAGHWMETYLHIIHYLLISVVLAWLLNIALKHFDKAISATWRKK